MNEARKSYWAVAAVTVKIHRETDWAILVSDDGNTPVWLPLAWVEAARIDNGVATVTAPEWLLIRKGLL